jgi:membrane-associated phospholipid phosphatase
LYAAKKIARVVSDLFIPPTFNLLGFIYIAMILQITTNEKIIVITSSIIFGVVLHIGLFVILRMKKIVTDNDAVNKEQRHIPYYIAIFLNLCGFVFVSLLSNVDIAADLWIILTLNTIGLTLINYLWKISAHAIGGATFVALLYFLESSLFVYFVILIILVGYSRYSLKVHTPAQIIAGTLYGFGFTLLQLNIVIRIT